MQQTQERQDSQHWSICPERFFRLNLVEAENRQHRPRRRGPATFDNKGAQESTSKPIDPDALAARGRVDATRKSEVQDVQAGSDQDIREKAKELERRKDEQ